MCLPAPRRRITSLSESERLYEFAHPVYGRRVVGVRGCRLRGVVRRLVNPVVATPARQASSCDSSSGSSRDRRTHWLARPCRQRLGLDRNRGLCRGRVVRLLLRAGRFERRR